MAVAGYYKTQIQVSSGSYQKPTVNRYNLTVMMY